MNQCNATITPMSVDADIRPATEDDEALSSSDVSLYRRQIGELLYLTVCTRPEMFFAVCALAGSLHAPTNRHIRMIRRELRYLSATKALGLWYMNNQNKFCAQAYSDSDWSRCKFTRHSRTGFVVNVNNTPVSWKSIRQSIIALSSAEAEYIALSTPSKELTWIRRFCWEMKYHHLFGQHSLIPTIGVFTGNTAALSISNQHGFNERTKHIEVKYPCVRGLKLLM